MFPCDYNRLLEHQNIIAHLQDPSIEYYGLNVIGDIEEFDHMLTEKYPERMKNTYSKTKNRIYPMNVCSHCGNGLVEKNNTKELFLVPGYGAQGGGAKDILPCFNSDGLGTIINSSKGILYTHMNNEERAQCSRQEYLLSVQAATKQMQEDIYSVLKNEYRQMIY